jgi:transcriptional regulator with XRE-family HTH domain
MKVKTFRKARLRAGLSQIEVAQCVGVSQAPEFRPALKVRFSFIYPPPIIGS